MPRSRSLEIFSDPATWAGEVLEVDLVKGEKGLGFSILDYQVLKVKDLLISIIIPKKCRHLIIFSSLGPLPPRQYSDRCQRPCAGWSCHAGKR